MSHVVPTPKRTLRLPVKAHSEPSLAQWAHVAAAELELLEALLVELDDELLEAALLLELAATYLAVMVC